MKFRLTYEGELRATNGEPRLGQVNPLALHKQQIRRIFHRQLRQLWATNLFLTEYKRHPIDSIDNRPLYQSGAYWDHNEKEKIPLLNYIASKYSENGYSFVPLVCEEFKLLCSLQILFLRRDIPGSAIQAGDIDNRIKTLIDALRKPQSAAELRGSEIPQEGEQPFFCLLEDDKLISHFSVETDTLLDEAVRDEGDRRRVKVVITVEIRPYLATYFNLSFS